MDSESLKLSLFPPSPYSQKLIFFLNEIDREIETQYLNLRKAEHKEPQVLQANPSARVPFLEAGDKTIAGSHTILRFLAHHFAPEYFRDSQRFMIDSQLDFIDQHLTPFARELVWQRVLFPRAGRPVSSDRENWAEAQVTRSLQFLENQLGENEFLSESLTIADFAALPAIRFCQLASVLLDEVPKVLKWYQRMTAKDSWQKTLIEMERYEKSLKQD